MFNDAKVPHKTKNPHKAGSMLFVGAQERTRTSTELPAST